MNIFPSVGYIFFDQEIAIPSYYPVGTYENAPLLIELLTFSEFGLVLPLSRLVPDGEKITREYFENIGESIAGIAAFITIDKDGYINEYHVSKETGKLVNWPYPKTRSKLIKTNAVLLNGQFNRNIERVHSIDSAILQFEKITGIPADTFTVYNKAELVKYVNGELLLESVPSRVVNSQYVFTWLGEN